MRWERNIQTVHCLSLLGLLAVIISVGGSTAVRIGGYRTWFSTCYGDQDKRYFDALYYGSIAQVAFGVAWIVGGIAFLVMCGLR